MPIRPEFRWLYPINWPQLSALIRFKRAQGAAKDAVGPTAKSSSTSATGVSGTASSRFGVTMRGAFYTLELSRH
jgi:hypothetical protein